MLLWFLGGSFVATWAVFRSAALDYRLVMLGAVLPLAELPLGGPRVLHTLVGSVATLLVVMAATQRRRLIRRRWLCLPIGMFLHLVLDGAWTRTEVFWWPAGGWSLPRQRSLIISRGIWSVLLELIGIVLAVWLFDRFGLEDRDRRHRFLTTGQLDRQFMRDGSGPRSLGDDRG